ncbi:MAG: M55 family metallopeptidase [Actinomycetota bacterium]|nr:M55 family metallopeptidase [Actinomycetota bacterium]
MRVFIISDMEGVAGICRWDQVTGGKPLYEEGRRLYTEEINAAVRGARAAGADEIIVMDCHGAGSDWSFNSLIPDLLDPGCEWVVQNEWTEYTGILEDGCDAALFVAMHAKAGTPTGVLSHTVSGTNWRNLWFNGTSVGETGINAALCGTWNCPVVLVTGDRATCAEAEALLGPEVETVPVKTGLGRYSARHLPPVRARRLIEEAAERAVARRDEIPPYIPASPSEIEVELVAPDRLEAFRSRRGVEIKWDETRVISRAPDWWQAWQQVYL